jgi:hypothetical protein
MSDGRVYEESITLKERERNDETVELILIMVYTATNC